MACRHNIHGLAPCWVAEKLQPHSQEKHRRGLWPTAVSRGAFYYPIALKPSSRQSQRDVIVNGCYTMGHSLFTSEENTQILSQSFCRRLWGWNNSAVVKLRYQSIYKRFRTWISTLWNQITQTKSVSRTQKFFEMWGCYVHEHKVCRKY